jgi:hypothetical protein
MISRGVRVKEKQAVGIESVWQSSHRRLVDTSSTVHPIHSYTFNSNIQYNISNVTDSGCEFSIGWIQTNTVTLLPRVASISWATI